MRIRTGSTEIDGTSIRQSGSQKESPAVSGIRRLWRSTLSSPAVHFLHTALEILFPPAVSCAGCGRPLATLAPTVLCHECLKSLPLVVPPICSRCGKPLRLTNQAECADCISRNRLFVRHRAVGVYDGMLKEMIHGLKYRQKREVALPLGRLMARVVRDENFDTVQGIVPVPLHPARQAVRGYNQAELLSIAVARKTNLPLVMSVQRVKDTQYQSGLSPEARKKNLQGAFSVYNTTEIAGRRLLVVDDIYTTGSTLESLARVLLRFGAAEVYGISVAIGVRDKDWT